MALISNPLPYLAAAASLMLVSYQGALIAGTASNAASSARIKVHISSPQIVNRAGKGDRLQNRPERSHAVEPRLERSPVVPNHKIIIADKAKRSMV
jgi:hypothetical protein